MVCIHPLRRLVGSLLAIAIAIPVTLGAVTGTVRHRECQARDHGCGHAAVLACCCHDDDAGPSAPALPVSSTDFAGANATMNAAPVFLAVVPERLEEAAGLHLHSPPPRGQATDLSVLFSTFLI
jgi:hypothetical protein